MFVPDLNAVLGGEGYKSGGFKVVAVPFEESPFGVKCFDVDFVNFCDFLEGVFDFEVGICRGICGRFGG